MLQAGGFTVDQGQQGGIANRFEKRPVLGYGDGAPVLKQGFQYNQIPGFQPAGALEIQEQGPLVVDCRPDPAQPFALFLYPGEAFFLLEFFLKFTG